MTTQSDLLKFIQDHGYCLQYMGLSEVALNWTDVQDAGVLALKCQLPILGGDVYFLAKGIIELAYANWHVDRRNDENYEVFVQRSYKETFQYLKSLPSLVDKEYLFVLVLGAEINP